MPLRKFKLLKLIASIIYAKYKQLEEGKLHSLDICLISTYVDKGMEAWCWGWRILPYVLEYITFFVKGVYKVHLHEMNSSCEKHLGGVP
jgi:hypothetical protein